MTDGREEGLRVDVLLDRLCLMRSRNEAKTACDAGAVQVNGKRAKASLTVEPGARIQISYPHSTLELELRALPARSTPKKAARELYEVLRDGRTG